jgi:phosphonate transport system substrate-binding protein
MSAEKKTMTKIFQFKFQQTLILLILGLISACSKPTDDENIIRMAFNPAESSDKVNTNGKLVGDLLEKSTGLKFKTFVASDYTALITALKTGQADIAWLAPFAFVLAENKAGAQVLLKSVRNGVASQYSAIIVKEDSPYKKIEDLKGKTIAWTDPASSSGHISPKSALISIGITPDTFFSKQTYAGSHETLVMAVSNGTVDAGATFSNDAEGKEGSWTRYMNKMGSKAKPLRSIYVTPPMPSDTVSISKKFAEKFPSKVAAIKEALKKLSDTAEGREALKILYNIEALVDSKTEDYEPLRKAATLIGTEVLDKK